ncbi:dual specificity protein phosphatase family protein [Halopiger goleimassiliensis]|uniref:dual specificity protein phosphatase family protein n=1 Tax=Halopiger goleimassiliensis TaxID=1293048 RepID=UPI000A647DB6|nr:dual specificity protein phosphatase [Halopiger goleimassiliensis]
MTRNEPEIGAEIGTGTGSGSSAADALEDDTPLVRPKGYVADEPIIRRIGDRELFLGNEHAADPTRHDRAFEFVVSVSSESQPLTTHHRPLTDGPGTEWSAFETAVDTARQCYRRNGATLIHCAAGISRSSTLVATTIAAEEGVSFREALEHVHDARPLAFPNPALHELAVVYLAATADTDRPIRRSNRD